MTNHHPLIGKKYRDIDPSELKYGYAVNSEGIIVEVLTKEELKYKARRTKKIAQELKIKGAVS